MADPSTTERDIIEKLADSFMTSYRSGQRPSIDAYVEQYPDLADQLRGLITALIVLEQNAPHRERFEASPHRALRAGGAPREIGEFTIVREIGRGGMGVVYEAVQQSLGRHVALKVLSSGSLMNPVHLERFRLEARSAGRLHHSHIVPVFGVGEHDGLHYYAMQFIPGQSLDEVIDELRKLRPGHGDNKTAPLVKDELTASIAGGLLSGQFRGDVSADGDSAVDPSTAMDNVASKTSQRSAHVSTGASLAAHKEFSSGSSGRPFYESVARVGLQVAEALAYAHTEGMLHRDIKPSNLILDAKGNIWVTDFGLVKVENSQALTEIGDFVGTLRYMAPERLDGWSDRRSDIYGLGASLYELLTLRTFFEGASRGQLIDDIRYVQPQPPTKLDPSIPRDLETIVLKALAKEPGSRYHTAEEMADDLRRFLADRPILARRSSAHERVVRWCRHNPAVAALAGGLAGTLLLGSIGSAYYAVQANTRAREATAAVAEKDRALHEKDEALQLAEEKDLLQRRRFYAAQMNLAQQSLAAGNLARALDLLENHRPRSGQADLRGFEWHYLWGELHRCLRTSFAHTEGGDYGRSVEVPEGTVEHWALAVAPDGTTVATGGGVYGTFGALKIWNARTADLKQTVRLPTSVTGLAFSRDGAMLAGACQGRTIHTWDTASGALIGENSYVGGLVTTLCFSPDGKRLAAGDNSGHLSIYDVASRELVAEGKQVRGHVRKVAYSPDGTRLYASSSWGADGDRTLVYDPAMNPPTVIDEIKDLTFRDISADGRLLACGWHRSVTIWDVRAGHVAWQFAAHPDAINDMRFTPDAKMLITAGADRTLTVWDLGARRARDRFPHFSVKSVGCGAGQSGEFVSLGGDGTVRVWDLAATAEAATISPAKPVRHMVVMPSGQSAILVGDTAPAEIWDLETGQRTADLLPADDVRSVSADGSIVASVDRFKTDDRHAIRVWSRPLDRLLHVIKLPQNHVPEQVRLSPNGKRLASVGWGTSILVWDLTTPSTNLADARSIVFKSPFFGEACQAMHIEFSPHSDLLAAAHMNAPVNIYNLTTKQIASLPLPNAPCWNTKVAFSADGKLLACGNEAGDVSVFDIGTADVVAFLKGHESTIASLAFFPDGQTLAVGTLNSIRLWDLPSHQEQINLTLNDDAPLGQAATVEQLAVTADGRTLVSRQNDGTVRVWRGGDDSARPATDSNHTSGQSPDAQTNDPRFFARRAIVRAGLSRWDRALADIRAAQQLGMTWDGPTLTMLLHALPACDASTNAIETIAMKQFREVVTQTVLATVAESKDGQSLHAIAWNFLTSDEANPFMHTVALRAAQKAFDLAPEAAKLNTLGVAKYRAGEWQQAIALLNQAEEMMPNQYLGFNGFFLALAHWQLGQGNEARTWYDRSVEWMEKDHSKNEDLVRFRAEAEQSLGIAPPNPIPMDAPQGDSANPKS